MAESNHMTEYQVRVPEAWLDYNQHMNVAYYTMAFDQAGEAFVDAIGMGETYTQQTKNSWVVLEAHITYQQEAHLGDELHIVNRVLNHDLKRIHLSQEMHRGEELLATQEQMILHVNLEARRAAPFEAEILAEIERLYAAQSTMPKPEWSGRSIGLKKKKPGT